MQAHFDITNFEVTDLMRYMEALKKQFNALSKSFSTERFVKLRDQSAKKRTKDNSSILSKTSFSIGRALFQDPEVKELHVNFKAAKQARSLLNESLKAHKVGDDHERSITEILKLMGECGQLNNVERTITGRHAYDTLTVENIE